MKLHHFFILSGALVGAAPSLSFADCNPKCGDGYVCSVTAQGPPAVFGCIKEKATYDVRKSGTVKAVGGGTPAGGGAVGGSPRSGTSVPRSNAKIGEEHTGMGKKGPATANSPRDPASGLPTGK